MAKEDEPPMTNVQSPLQTLQQTTLGLGAAIGSTVLGLVAYWLITRGMGKLMREGHLNETMARRLRMLARWGLVAAVLLITTEQLGIFANAWATISAFVVAMAVGFVALWSVMSNVVCAIMILVYRPFRIGDDVELVEASGSGPKGKVIDLNLMYTTLEEPPVEGSEAALLRVPNSQFFLKPLRYRPVREDTERRSFLDPKSRPQHPLP